MAVAIKSDEVEASQLGESRESFFLRDQWNWSLHFLSKIVKTDSLRT